MLWFLCHILYKGLRQNFVMLQFYFLYILTIPYTCAGPAVFPREVWGLFTVILLHVYDMWRMKKTTRTPSRSAHAIWMEVISLNRGDAKKLRATSFFFIFFYIFLLFVYPETRKIVFACHLHEENKIKLSKKLIFNIYPLTAFWQAMYQNYY